MKSSNPNILSFYSSTTVSIIVGVIHYAMSNVTKQFAEVFEGFGAELPLLTRFLVQDSFYFWIIPIAIVISLVAHQLGYLSRPSILLLSSLGTIASIILCTVGLYLPIFQLGAVVQ